MLVPSKWVEARCKLLQDSVPSHTNAAPYWPMLSLDSLSKKGRCKHLQLPSQWPAQRGQLHLLRLPQVKGRWLLRLLVLLRLLGGSGGGNASEAGLEFLGSREATEARGRVLQKF